MSMDILILALALVLIFEGMGPALFPKKWRRYLQEISQLPVAQLRGIGVALIMVGWLLFLWFKP